MSYLLPGLTILIFINCGCFVRENICCIVKAPAVVPWKIRKLATDVAHKAVSSFEGAGVFAVELFLTEDGEVRFTNFCFHFEEFHYSLKTF